LIDIAGGGIMRKATVCPVSRKLPEHYNGNSILDVSILAIIFVNIKTSIMTNLT